MEISASFLSSAFPCRSVPVMLAAFCISDMCFYLGLFIHPVLHLSHYVFLGECLCQFDFHMAVAELLRSPLKCYSNPPTLFVSIILSFVLPCCLGLIKGSPTPRQSDHVQALQPFLSNSQHSCMFPSFHLPYIHMGDICNCPFPPITNQKSIQLFLRIFSPV